MREPIVLVYILQNRVEKGIVYFFSQSMFRAILLFTFGCLDNISISFDSRKIRISVFYMTEHIELFYILQNGVEKNIVYIFCQTIFRAILLLTLDCLGSIQNVFNSHKIRISLFYMRENIELVYILQNRVQNGAV